MLGTVWGENAVENPEDLVYPTGDMIIAIRNYGTTTVTIDNLTITIVFESRRWRNYKNRALND